MDLNDFHFYIKVFWGRTRENEIQMFKLNVEKKTFPQHDN